MIMGKTVNETTLWWHFIRFDIKSHSPRIHTWLGNSYSSLDRAFAFPSSSRWTLHFEESESPHQIPIRGQQGAQALGVSSAGIPLFFNGAVICGQSNGANPSSLYIDFNNKILEANVGGDLARYSDCFVYGLFRNIMRLFILPSCGAIMLHGAVVTRGSTSILLSGKSGAGKSTTALQLLSKGFSVVSDDSPLFCMMQDRVMALSSLDHFAVSKETLQLLPDLQAHVQEGLGTQLSAKPRVNRAYQGDELPDPVSISEVVILDRRAVSAAPLLHQATRHEAMVSLLSEALSFHKGDNSSQASSILQRRDALVFDIISNILNTASVHRLEFSADQAREIPNLFEDRFGGSS